MSGEGRLERLSGLRPWVAEGGGGEEEPTRGAVPIPTGRALELSGQVDRECATQYPAVQIAGGAEPLVLRVTRRPLETIMELIL